ncbi:hypothetical protein CDV31_010706 [Fusarium ambrosium]|uniref:Uncharacterized protein n=1 Tax=Fusarium ambrosium TaxID=131363 RepID=A0A428TLS5_9HYPO|nr:hypothetical protein CDV31_010706 [Fusarium ambrosium]
MPTHSFIAEPFEANPFEVDPVDVDPADVNSVEVWAESHEPVWSDWTPVQGGWIRRRPTVPGMNDHWGEWCLNWSHNQYFRFNPAADGTHIETATEEFQFHWDDPNQASVIPQDHDAGQTSASRWWHWWGSDPKQYTGDDDTGQASAPGWWGGGPKQYVGDQGSKIIGEPGNLLVFDPDEVGQQAVDVERSGMETERDERDFEQPTAAPSKSDRKRRNITRHKKPRGQRHGTSSAKSAVGSFASSVASTSDHAVTTSSSATETANTTATWIFGTIMAGIGYGAMRAAQKSAEASMRSAVAVESSALSSRRSATAAYRSAEAGERSAQAAEESAQAGRESAWAAENGVAVMQRQLEFMIQDRRGPPPRAGSSSGGSPTNNDGCEIRSVEVRRPDVGISREQPRARSVSTAPPLVPVTALTSAPVDIPQEGVPTGGSPEQIDAAQTSEVTQNSATSNRPAVPIETTPSARTLTSSSAGITTVNISWPQVPTADPGQPSVNESPPKQGPSIGTGAMTFPEETTQQKEEVLRNITVVRDEQKSREEEERERMLVLDRRLRELRDKFA